MFNIELYKSEVRIKNNDELKKTIKNLKGSNYWNDKLTLRLAREELNRRSK
tara:strand:+ start:307 stop:459 length:153 start_codon:yes stop_codon:yes gene_type:complete